MEKSYHNEDLDPKSEFIASAIKKLPKLNAPENFEEKLFRNIRRIDQGENFTAIPHKIDWQNWTVGSLSIAAGIALAVFIFQPNNMPTNTLNPISQDKQLEIQKKDSLKEVQKNFDQNLNLVKERKNQ